MVAMDSKKTNEGWEVKFEERLKELEAMADQLEAALEDKNKTIAELTSENAKLKAEVSSQMDIISYQRKERLENASKLAALKRQIKEQRTLDEDIEYGRKLARNYAGRIRSDG